MKRSITLTLVFAMLLSICIPVSAIPNAEATEAAATVQVSAAETPAYQDERYSYAERAVDMVSRMTLAEKASQTAGYNASAIPRLGISSYMWWNEALHGYSQEGWFGITTDGASYPSSYSMGASWDPDLYYQEAVQIGEEIRERVKGNKYNLTFFSPTVNLARDPRWGRNDESYGEDPLLVGLMGSSFVKGVEGKNEDGSYKLVNANGEGIKQAVTTIKHYAANNSEKNRYTSGADNVTVREMREYYTRPARIVVDNADVSSVMMAYSSVSGIPISFSSYYMDTLLRQTYGFSGYIVSDCDSIATSFNRNVHKNNPHTGTGYTMGQAFANAMANGLDLQCNAGETDGLGSYASNYSLMLKNEDGSPVKTDKGFFTEQQLEVTVARLMEKRMQLGEFDAVNDYVTQGAQRLAEGNNGAYVNKAAGQTQERIDLADELSRSTIVLLKNKDKALPITEQEINSSDTYKVNIIGPVGQSNFRGGYSSRSSNEANLVTIEQAIKTAFNDTETYAQSTIDKISMDYIYGFSSPVSRSSFTSLSAEKIDLSKVQENLDLAIVVVGQGSGDSREDGDRTDLRLAEAQIELIKQVKAKNPKKLILVMETYGPVQMTSDIVDNADAILWSSFNGFRKGTGFGEAITGKNNPSGRTNATWLADTINDIPGFFDYSLYPSEGNGGRTYMYNVEDTIFPFGYGLSYADVEYAPVSEAASILGAASANSLVLGDAGSPITKDTVMNVSFNITNTNNVAGKQVAEVYVVSPNAGVGETPLKRLVGFDKVNVEANGTTTVSIPLSVTDFAFFNEEKDCYELPTGEWQIWVARSSEFNDETDLMEKFTVVNGDIREDPSVVTVKPTQIGDGAENGVSERVIFTLQDDASKNIILPNVAVTMANEKLYGTRVMNNIPGVDIGVAADAVNASNEDHWSTPDSAASAARLEDGKTADALPRVGEKYTLPDSYKVTYASNRPEVVQAGSATAAGEFASGALVMKAPGVATITVQVEAPSGESATTEFAVCVTAPPALKELTVGGKAIEDFDGSLRSYAVSVPAGVAVSSSGLTVNAVAVAGAKVEYSTTDDGTGTIGYAASPKGINPTGLPGTVYIKVSGDSVADQIYSVKFERQLSAMSFLDGKVNGEWSVVNEDKTAYQAVKGMGLKLTALSGTLSAANNNWKNLFLHPCAGDWTMLTKLTFGDGPVKGQQVQLIAWQDASNMISLSLAGPRTSPFAWLNSPYMSITMAPTIGGASNGSIRCTTNIKPEEGKPVTMYVKLQREGLKFTAWYSFDGVNFAQVMSADGRRKSEASFLNDIYLGLFATSGSATAPALDVYCEYMDLMSKDGQQLKTEAKVLSDAFLAVADVVKEQIPATVTADLKPAMPLDYKITFEASDCIASDGTVTKPPVDKTVDLKVKLTHETAQVNGSNTVTAFDGKVLVKGNTSQTDYGVTPDELTVQVGTEKKLSVFMNNDIVMSADVSVADGAVASVSETTLETSGEVLVKGLKEGDTTITVTWYGLPNNVELDSSTVKIHVEKSVVDPDPVVKFDDVSEKSWYFESVTIAAQKGIVNGMGNNKFVPNGTLTRAELVTMLYRVAGEPAVSASGFFTDVQAGQWYTEAIEWAAANGIVNGMGNNRFDPDGKITREQIATILYRYSGSPAVEGSLTKFPDHSQVSGYAANAMLWAVNRGIIHGSKDSTGIFLHPRNNATRAEAAAILVRFLDI